jgi:hypothetical protein
MFVPTTIRPATSTSGTAPIQYFVQSRARRSKGDDLSSQKVRPSSETAGKTKRAAIAAITKPTSPMFRKLITFTRKKPTSSPWKSGSTLML